MRPDALRRIERDIAVAEHGFFIRAVGEASKADRCGDLNVRALDEDRSGEALLDLLGDFFAEASSIAGSRTANSSPPVRAQHAPSGAVLCERLGNPEQHLVAGKMAVKIVDSLEVIEVEHEENARPRRASSASPSERISSRRLARPVVGSVLAFRSAARSAFS